MACFRPVAWRPTPGGRRRYGRHRRHQSPSVCQAGRRKWDGETGFQGGTSHSLMPLLETTFPTASEDVLDSQTLILSPAIVYVQDIKLLSPGFIAAMNFLDIDGWRDDSVEGTFRYSRPLVPDAALDHAWSEPPGRSLSPARVPAGLGHQREGVLVLGRSRARQDSGAWPHPLRETRRRRRPGGQRARVDHGNRLPLVLLGA